MFPFFHIGFANHGDTIGLGMIFLNKLLDSSRKMKKIVDGIVNHGNILDLRMMFLKFHELIKIVEEGR